MGWSDRFHHRVLAIYIAVIDNKKTDDCAHVIIVWRTSDHVR